MPHIYDGRDKTFFCLTEEFRRVINYNAANAQIPTVDERQGIFANPVCTALSADFSTCTDTGTRITNISPLAQAYVKDIFSKLPAPANGNNIFVPLRGVFNARPEITMLDQHLG